MKWKFEHQTSQWTKTERLLLLGSSRSLELRNHTFHKALE